MYVSGRFVIMYTLIKPYNIEKVFWHHIGVAFTECPVSSAGFRHTYTYAYAIFRDNIYS